MCFERDSSRDELGRFIWDDPVSASDHKASPKNTEGFCEDEPGDGWYFLRAGRRAKCFAFVTSLSSHNGPAAGSFTFTLHLHS